METTALSWEDTERIACERGFTFQCDATNGRLIAKERKNPRYNSYIAPPSDTPEMHMEQTETLPNGAVVINLIGTLRILAFRTCDYLDRKVSLQARREMIAEILSPVAEK